MADDSGEVFVPRNDDTESSGGILARAVRWFGGLGGLRVDADRLRPDRREAVAQWVRSLGVDPNDVQPKFLIRSGQSQYELHLSRFVRDGDGQMVVDQAGDTVVTEPVVIEIGTEKSWPDLTGGVQ